MKNKAVQEILGQEVSRKEFLLQVGAILLAISGISTLMHNLGNIFGNNKATQPRDQGYGGSTYSGIK